MLFIASGYIYSGAQKTIESFLSFIEKGHQEFDDLYLIYIYSLKFVLRASKRELKFLLMQ